jgi:ABC-type multidrug transport system ATPase subunit
VRVDALFKRYAGTVALDGVSLRLAAGELYGLVGADGAGKSSLMQSIAGVLVPDGGSVSLFGEPVAGEADARRAQARIGFVPQGLGMHLYPELTVDEHLRFFAELRGVGAALLAERAAVLLAATQLKAFRTRPMKLLSGGMRQKLALACALVHAPELLLLDEPTTGVDPLSRRDFWLLLPTLMQAQRMSVIVATGYLDEADRFDRVGLLYRGRLAAEGTPAELRAARKDGAPGAGAGPVPEPDLEDAFVARICALENLPAPPPAATPPPVGTASPASPAIEARHLTRDFDRFRAADDVSFTVAPGEIVGLLGANGAGKTTVIKMLTGILPPSAGVGQVAGADMQRSTRALRERIGYVSQSFSLYADLSVRDNLRLYAGVYGLHGAAARARIDAVVALGGLAGALALETGRVPTGLRQRLALCCALLHQPRVLFLDEPTSGVDPLGRRQFWRILVALAREGGAAILLSTHHMSEAAQCDRLVLMFAGRVIADDTPAQLQQQVLREAGRLVELRCDTPGRALALLRQAGQADAALLGRTLQWHVIDAATATRSVQLLRDAGLRCEPPRVRAPGLEEVFVQRIGALHGQAGP